MKSMGLFTNILDVKHATEKCRFSAAKSRLKDMKVCNSLWTKKQKNKRVFKNQLAGQT